MKKTRTKREYDPKIAEEICNAIATTTKGLRILCEENPHWPRKTTIHEWVFKYDEFNDLYARAKRLQTEANIELLQEMIEVDPTYDADDKRRIDSGIFRAKMDAIKWMACKLQPRKYGDVQQQSSNNHVHEETMRHKEQLDEKNKKPF